MVVKIGRVSSRPVVVKPEVGEINAFKLGDVLQVNFHPEDAESEWVRSWNNPMRDTEDIEQAREIVATRGSCLGWASSTAIDKFGYRTITLADPGWAVVLEVNGRINTITGKLLGPRG